jgi:hypothetical protein
MMARDVALDEADQSRAATRITLRPHDPEPARRWRKGRSSKDIDHRAIGTVSLSRACSEVDRYIKGLTAKS